MKPFFSINIYDNTDWGEVMLEIKDLQVDKSEVLRYLGHRGQEIDENIKKLVSECREEIKKTINPKWTYEYRNINITNEGVEVEGTNLILYGNDIKDLLKECRKCALMAVTLGNEIERKTRFYERTNLTKALILDACANTIVEEICDKVEDEIKREAAKENMSITYRYSPGYGDLPIETQNSFLRTVNAEKIIGLTVSSSNILLPRKSVTAIIGLSDKKIEKKKRDCSTCNNRENCSFRREGEFCGA